MLIVLVPLFFFLLWLYLFERAGRAEIRLSFVKTLVLGFVVVTFATEFFSLFGLLNVYTFGGFWLAGSVLLAAVVSGHLRQTALTFWERMISQLKSAPYLVTAGVGVLLLIIFVIAVASPPNTYDSQTYHLARVAHWTQNGSVAHYPTAILRQLYQPPLAEFAALHLQILSGGDHVANIVQWVSLIGCAAAASLIARELGLELKMQAFAAALVVTLPGAIVQGSSTQNDLVASLLTLAFFLFFLLSVRSDDPGFGYLWTGAALGLALLTKGTSYLYCFPVGAFFSVVHFFTLTDGASRIRFGRRVAIVIVIALALNFGHFARNFSLFGTPVTSGDDEVRNKNVTAQMVLANAARNYAVNLGTSSVTLRNAIEGAMKRVFGAELKNPNSTWLDNEFKVEFSAHEDLAGNFLHIVLVTLALFLAFFAVRRARDGSGVIVAGLAFTVVFGFFLFSALLKWQIWSARLQLPLLMLGSVLVAYTVAKLLPRAAYVLLALAFASAIPFLLFAAPRRVLGDNGRFVLFDGERRHKLFKNLPDAEPLYSAAAEAIKQQPVAPEAVGLHIDYNDFDYPLWGLLKDDPRSPPLIFHVGVTNVSKRLAGSRPAPEFVISTLTGTSMDGVQYREIWKNDVVRVLRRVDDADRQ